jgi:membrane protein
MMPRRISDLASFLRFVWKRFNEGRCTEVAASLTYTTLLSLVPLITITLSVIAAFPISADLSEHLKAFVLANLLPESASKVFSVYMVQFSENAARLSALGFAFLILTSLVLMHTINCAFHDIWHVSKQRTLLHRLVVYWAVLTVGPLLVGSSISVTSYLASFSLGFVKHVPLLDMMLLNFAPLLLTTAALTLLYKAVPNRHVPWSHALIGAVVAGAVFELMKNNLFAVYVIHFASYRLVYGAFASFPIFLLWVYLSWLVVLAGAVLAASLSYWEAAAWHVERRPGHRFYLALRVLSVLYRNHQSGEVASARQLSAQLGMGPDEMDDVLDQFDAANWAHRVASGGWVLTKSPQQIKVREVYRRFVFEPAREGVDVPASLLDSVARLDDTLDVSLAALYGSELEASPAKE